MRAISPDGQRMKAEGRWIQLKYGHFYLHLAATIYRVPYKLRLLARQLRFTQKKDARLANQTTAAVASEHATVLAAERSERAKEKEELVRPFPMPFGSEKVPAFAVVLQQPLQTLK